MTMLVVVTDNILMDGILVVLVVTLYISLSIDLLEVSLVVSLCEHITTVCIVEGFNA
jgi:hypothetical protein